MVGQRYVSLDELVAACKAPFIFHNISFKHASFQVALFQQLLVHLPLLTLKLVLHLCQILITHNNLRFRKFILDTFLISPMFNFSHVALMTILVF